MPLPHYTKNPALSAKISQMSLPLRPLVRLTTSEAHPSFPLTLLNYWLLTSAQLEELASFYHQRTPCEWTQFYPCPVEWSGDLSLEGKRRKFGRFIGLRGCESPVRVLSEEEIFEEARRCRERGEEWGRKGGWYY